MQLPPPLPTVHAHIPATNQLQVLNLHHPIHSNPPRDQAAEELQQVREQTLALLQQQDTLTKRQVEHGAREQEVAVRQAELEHELARVKESQDADVDRARLKATLHVSAIGMCGYL